MPLVNDGLIDKLLLDCKIGEQSGGTGKNFDWQLVTKIEDMPFVNVNKKRLAIAGGINPSNVTQASHLNLGLIDVNSGIEHQAGLKTNEKLAALFQALRA